MRVLLLSLEDTPAAEGILRDLGCDVDLCGFVPALEKSTLPKSRPDILLIDSGPRPELGASELRRLREMEPLVDVPALLAVSAEQVMRVDFSAGFEDFVLTPWVPHELYIRLRQVEWHSSEFSAEEILKCEEMLVDVPGRVVTVAGRRIPLTRQEFELLAYLLRNRGRVHRREKLLRTLWGVRRNIVTRTVDIHVRRLREKLGSAGRHIETVRGVGYKLGVEGT